ncbi:MAG: MBL fold metallo-hydrolase [Desulfobacterales bacterium CG23_combo_of_CG06-09_8_20_14_all_51_8]|nr:MAG: MBL fold metallo-hydrolase [Desulfobacterales bacterium CG23_combo_of_CG06-09_8_20_14_all_51_8]
MTKVDEMKTVEKHTFGEVTGYELGFSPVGRPLMTVFCYVVGDILIDTGQSHMQETVLDIANIYSVSSVLLTHHHEDHSGNSAVLKQARKIPVFAHPATIEKMSGPYRVFPYQRWIWGPNTPVALDPFPDGFFEHGDLKFKAVHTPGHSRDHTSYLELNHGWLFSGDLYLGDRIKYFRADEKIADQIVSLKKILTYDFDALFCGHRPRPMKGKRCLAAKLRFLEDFYGRVSELADQGLDDRAIMGRLELKEQWLVRMMCFGNVSMRNMVRSAMAARRMERGD